jgi:hypothetical protein
VVDAPLHIVLSAPAFATTVGEMDIVTLLVAVQPALSVTVTVYVVVDKGLATGFAEVVEERPVAGDQL